MGFIYNTIKERLDEVDPTEARYHAYYLLDSKEPLKLEIQIAEDPVKALEAFFRVPCPKEIVSFYTFIQEHFSDRVLMLCEDSLEKILYGGYYRNLGLMLDSDWLKDILKVKDYLDERARFYIRSFKGLVLKVEVKDSEVEENDP